MKIKCYSSNPLCTRRWDFGLSYYASAFLQETMTTSTPNSGLPCAIILSFGFVSKKYNLLRFNVEPLGAIILSLHFPSKKYDCYIDHYS